MQPVAPRICDHGVPHSFVHARCNRQCGIPVKVDHSKTHMHHKFAVIDHRLLMNGSFNWTRQVCGDRLQKVWGGESRALLVIGSCSRVPASEETGARGRCGASLFIQRTHGLSRRCTLVSELQLQREGATTGQILSDHFLGGGLYEALAGAAPVRASLSQAALTV
eukprot:346289-Chlamydomonas_euryale.AAC.4